MNDIRFRAEGDLLVLQVCACKARTNSYGYYGESGGYEWRDAKVTDLLEVGEWLQRQRTPERVSIAEPGSMEIA